MTAIGLLTNYLERMFNNHFSIHKYYCRNKILDIVKNYPQRKAKFSNKAQRIRVLTLPSTNFLLEEELLDLETVKLTCCERDADTFKKQKEIIRNSNILKINDLSSNLRLINDDIFNILDNPFTPQDIVWADLCGPLQIRTINNFLSYIQTSDSTNDHYVAITFACKREQMAEVLLNFYETESLANFRDNYFIQLVKDFAEMANKTCEVTEQYKYRDTATPMQFIIFKLKTKQQ